MSSTLNQAYEKLKKENDGYFNDDLNSVLSVNPEYKILLEKFCDNKDLQNLIFYCIMDIKEGEEMSYVEKGEYPSKRDSLMKLRYDLELARKAKIVKELSLKNKE